MEILSVAAKVSILIVVGTLVVWGWRVLNWVWLRPRKLEKLLREQGFAGNSYRLFFGDSKKMMAMIEQAKSKPMNFTHDIAQRVYPFHHETINNYGKNSFMWVGPDPYVNIMEPEHLKTVLSLNNDIRKADYTNTLLGLLVDGVITEDGPKWAKQRKTMTPAFYLEKLKDTTPAFFQCCSELISKWETMVSKDGSCELDVVPYLQNMTADVISRSAFGSSFEEGKKIFQLQKELARLVVKSGVLANIPRWSFVPTKSNNRMKKIDKEIKGLLFDIISKRQRAMDAGEATSDDLLGLLLESNFNEIQEHGNNKDVGMTIEDVIGECKLFYLAGQETTGLLLVWTMVLLSSHPEWQERARVEVLEVLGNNKPDFNNLSRLKVVTMILNEVLRLYPPVGLIVRKFQNETRFGSLTLPAKVILNFPTIFIHHDRELWGEDAHEFKPERFSEGVSRATKNQFSYFPFGGGPRICMGQNFAMVEAKMALSMILQRFSFELSSSYTHAPHIFVTLQPQHGAHLILHKL